MGKQISNKQTFQLIVREIQSFRIVIDGFQAASTFFFRIRDKVKLTFAATLASSLRTTINIKKIRMVISQVKLTTALIQTINARRVSISYRISEKMKAIVAFNQKNRIGFILKAVQIAVVNFHISKVRLLTSPTLATFFTLGTHDPNTLGTLDTETLGDMDYTIT